MATIRERRTSKGETRYYVEVRRKGHRPVAKTFGTKTRAKAWARTIEGELEKRAYLPHLEASRHTLKEAVERYLEVAGDLAPRTLKLRRAELTWWNQRLGSLALSAMTPAAIADELHSLRRSVSGATCNRRLAALSAVLERARRDWEWIETNPARRVRRFQEASGRVRFLSDDERKALIEACGESSDRRLLPLVIFAITTGARQGELLGLTWRDVDLAADPPRAVLERTKNRDRRQLAFPGLAGELLREMARTPHISGYLFVGPRGGRGFPQEAWSAALERAEISDFRFHDLRHTAASYAAQAGATTLLELANFLGHRSLRMVQRYAHLTEQESEAVSRRVARRLRH